jgi:hypothetical protein
MLTTHQINLISLEGLISSSLFSILSSLYYLTSQRIFYNLCDVPRLQSRLQSVRNIHIFDEDAMAFQDQLDLLMPAGIFESKALSSSLITFPLLSSIL